MSRIRGKPEQTGKTFSLSFISFANTIPPPRPDGLTNVLYSTMRLCANPRLSVPDRGKKPRKSGKKLEISLVQSQHGEWGGWKPLHLRHFLCPLISDIVLVSIQRYSNVNITTFQSFLPTSSRFSGNEVNRAGEVRSIGEEMLLSTPRVDNDNRVTRYCVVLLSLRILTRWPTLAQFIEYCRGDICRVLDGANARWSRVLTGGDCLIPADTCAWLGTREGHEDSNCWIISSGVCMKLNKWAEEKPWADEAPHSGFCVCDLLL